MTKDNNPTRMSFNLGKLLILCIKNWWMFLISVFIIGGGTYFYTKTHPQLTQVDAQVMLPGDASPASFMADMAQSFSFADFMGGGSSTDNEMDVMRSHSVLLATVKEMGLNTVVLEKMGFMHWEARMIESPLRLSTNPETNDTISCSLRFDIKRLDSGGVNILVTRYNKPVTEIAQTNLPASVSTPYGNFTISATEYYKKTRAPKFRIFFSSYNSAAENLGKTVQIFIPNKKTEFIGLSVLTNQPEYGEALLSNIIKNYNNVGINQKNENNTRTLDFVNNRLKSLTQELAASESSIESFKTTNTITDPEVDVQAMLQKSTSIEGELIAAQTENEILSITRSFITNPDNNYALIPGLTAEAEASAAFTKASSEINTYNGLILERMKLLNSAKTGNPALQAITSQIDALRGNIITSVDRAYKNSQVKLSEIEKENSTARSRIGSYPALEREYLSLKRVQLVQEQLYMFLLKQREEVEMSIARSNPTTVTIDPPHALSKAPGLSPRMMLMLALMVALLLPLGWIFFKVYGVRSTISSIPDVASLPVPTMGCLGHIRGDSKLLTAEAGRDNRNQIAGEMLRALRHNLRYTLDGCPGGKVTLVTSTRRGEGKTTVALNIAASMAIVGKRTVLIDADLRNPGVADALNITDDKGLRQYLEGIIAEPPAVTINQEGTRDLDVITAGGMTAMSADLLGRDRMAALIAKLRERYDSIIIDATEAREYSDPFELADVTDVTIYVTRINRTTGSDLQYLGMLHNEGRLPRMTTTVNDVRDKVVNINNSTVKQPDTPELQQ